MAKIVGSTWTPMASFEDANEVPYDPTLVTTRVRAPDGSVDTPAPSNPAVGDYTVLVVLDQVGYWFVDFIGDGPDNEVVIVRGTVCVLPELVASS